MTSECPNCGKNFDTEKGMRIHKADCKKKDPSGIKGLHKRIEKNSSEMQKRIGKMFIK